MPGTHRPPDPTRREPPRAAKDVLAERRGGTLHRHVGQLVATIADGRSRGWAAVHSVGCPRDSLPPIRSRSVACRPAVPGPGGEPRTPARPTYSAATAQAVGL